MQRFFDKFNKFVKRNKIVKKTKLIDSQLTKAINEYESGAS